MAEPACKDCKYFSDQTWRGGTSRGECLDPTKRIYPRRTAGCEVEPPTIRDAEIYTCDNFQSNTEIGQSDEQSKK